MKHIVISLGCGSDGMGLVDSIAFAPNCRVEGINTDHDLPKADRLKNAYPGISVWVGTSCGILEPRPVSFPERYEGLPWENMRDAVLAREKVTLLTSGALTNPALLFMRYPEVREHFESIIILGGSAEEGDVTAFAERNIYADPFAAKVLFDAGIKTTMFGLNVTRGLSLPEREKLIAGYVLDQYEVETIERSIGVEVSSELTYGMTVCDIYRKAPAENNVRIITKINGGAA